MNHTITNNQLKAAYDIYQERITEAKLYLEFIKKIESGHTQLTNRENDIFTINRELKHTVYASIYLILYNIIESTSLAIIDAIHEDIKLNDIEEDYLIENLYERLLRQLGKYLSEGKIKEVLDLKMPKNKAMYIQLLNLAHDKSTIFSGNIDLLKIKGIAKDYGFSISPIRGEPYNPEDILVIKHLRNKLAHGGYSFSECGKDIVFSDSNIEVKTLINDNGKDKEVKLTSIAKKVLSVERLFNALFVNLDIYLTEQNYLNKTVL
ncbi:MAE_28990/MAE_18760 family HEPN-like nuclease [Psychrobacter piscatorii]|uniref:MAE-28990/MAE-18760-like HEPN domain-containing protein n=1 Tax=Psychrobacter piscatorii TaxID=554343 RepID=A0A0T6DTW1_9GAMM|nr:MAE_28990/MAE_18760 family HEPN-like nuclease [Psychrobacter piscatorii]KRU23275.1 hypothetical protein AS194_04930 [Psychrobacter piscatorii]